MSSSSRNSSQKSNKSNKCIEISIGCECKKLNKKDSRGSHGSRSKKRGRSRSKSSSNDDNERRECHTRHKSVSFDKRSMKQEGSKSRKRSRSRSSQRRVQTVNSACQCDDEDDNEYDNDYNNDEEDADDASNQCGYSGDNNPPQEPCNCQQNTMQCTKTNPNVKTLELHIDMTPGKNNTDPQPKSQTQTGGAKTQSGGGKTQSKGCKTQSKGCKSHSRGGQTPARGGETNEESGEETPPNISCKQNRNLETQKKKFEKEFEKFSQKLKKELEKPDDLPCLGPHACCPCATASGRKYLQDACKNPDDVEKSEIARENKKSRSKDGEKQNQQQGGQVQQCQQGAGGQQQATVMLDAKTIAQLTQLLSSQQQGKQGC